MFRISVVSYYIPIILIEIRLFILLNPLFLSIGFTGFNGVDYFLLCLLDLFTSLRGTSSQLLSRSYLQLTGVYLDILVTLKLTLWFT